LFQSCFSFSIAPEKTAMLASKLTLPDSPHPVIMGNNPAFLALLRHSTVQGASIKQRLQNMKSQQ